MREDQPSDSGKSVPGERKSRLKEAGYSANIDKPEYAVPGYSKRSQFCYRYTPWLALLLVVGVSLGLFVLAPSSAEQAAEAAGRGILSSGVSENAGSGELSSRFSAASERLFEPLSDLRQEMGKPARGWGCSQAEGISRFFGEVSLGGEQIPVSLFHSGSFMLLQLGEGDDSRCLGTDQGIPLRWQQDANGKLMVENVTLFEMGLIEAVVRSQCPLKEALMDGGARILRVDRESLKDFGKVTVHYQVSGGVEDVDLAEEGYWTTRWRKRSFPAGDLVVSYGDFSANRHGVFPHRIEIRWGSGEEAEVLFHSFEEVEPMGPQSLPTLVRAAVDIPSPTIP